MATQTRNSEVLAGFIAYCQAHPRERFWQALRTWSGWHFIMAASLDNTTCADTFYWEGRDG